MDCPRKLYYGGLKGVYANQQIDDPFLESLAEGGFQVGELAKEYFSGGIDIQTLDYNEALEQTNKLLKQESVIIFEAADRINLSQPANGLTLPVPIAHRNRSKSRARGPR